MKKVLLMLAFILPMACSFVACSSDDEPEVTELTDSNLATLQGTWNVSESSENPFYGKLKILVSDNRIVLFQKKPSDTNFEEVDSYTFEVDGKTLVLTNEWTDKVEATIEILSLSSNKAKIKVTDLAYGYGSYPLQLTKVK